MTLNTETKELISQDKRLKNWLVANGIFLLTLIFFGGAWVRGIEKDIEHVRESMEIRTEDRFYKQDGLILEARITALEANYTRIEEALVRLDAKLDR
jgi:hypothetical protein